MQSWIRFTSLVFAACVAILALINVVTAQNHRTHATYGHMTGQYMVR